jgi:AGZA family xanthine/uracil permease-like MFS transporter
VKGAILVGIGANIVLGLVLGIFKYSGLVSMPPSIAPTFMQMDVRGVLELQYAVPVIVFLFMAMFDTVGTLIGVTSQAGFVKDGKVPRAGRVLMADAVATTAGAALGSSTTLAFVESIAGIKVGGRTGLTAVVVGSLFLVALFFYPLVGMVSKGVALDSGLVVHPATAPALILVGSMMMWGVKDIQWDDMFEAIPAFLTIVAIPFSYSIADGIAFGFISYPLLKLFGGRAREVSPIVYVLGALFAARYIFL